MYPLAIVHIVTLSQKDGRHYDASSQSYCMPVTVSYYFIAYCCRVIPVSVASIVHVNPGCQDPVVTTSLNVRQTLA